MKPIAVLMMAVAAILFSACSSNEFLVMDSAKKRAPLDPQTQVRFIYAPEIPVIPENTEFIAVMNTNVNSDCNMDDAVRALESAAREVGADLVFVKKYEDQTVSRGVYLGKVYMSHTETCSVLTADLLKTK